MGPAVTAAGGYGGPPGPARAVMLLAPGVSPAKVKAAGFSTGPGLLLAV